MIRSVNCPVCHQNLATEEMNLNQHVRDHHENEHPTTFKLIVEGQLAVAQLWMEIAELPPAEVLGIGKRKDKIARLRKKVKRLTGFRIPGE